MTNSRISLTEMGRIDLNHRFGQIMLFAGFLVMFFLGAFGLIALIWSHCVGNPMESWVTQCTWGFALLIALDARFEEYWYQKVLTGYREGVIPFEFD